MSRSGRIAILAAVFSCIGACGQLKTVGSKYVVSETVTAAEGKSITVLASDSPELAGTVLKIEPGALSANTTITLELGVSDLVVDGKTPAGPVAIWGPAGTKFTRPVELTLPYVLPAGESLDRVFIQVREADGTTFVVDPKRITFDEVNHLARFTVDGFTGFQPGVGQQCTANTACPSGESCVMGMCRATGCGSTNSCGCTDNSQCAAGEICANGLCQG